MQERFISVSKGKIWCGIVSGDSPGIPLLVLHGGPGAPHDYLEPLQALADQRPVIFYDQLGCGRSPSPANPDLWTLEYFCSELHELLAALGLRRFHVLGQSWGAFLAVSYYIRFRPSSLKSMSLCGPCLSVPQWIADQQQYLRMMPDDQQRVIRKAEKTGVCDSPEYQAATDAYFKAHVCRMEPWPEPFMRTLDGFNGELYRYMWGASEFSVSGLLRDEDLSSQLPSLELPVLLTCGEFDEAAPETVHQYAAAMPDARVHVFADASHCHHLEQPGPFIRVLREFLQQADSASE